MNRRQVLRGLGGSALALTGARIGMARAAAGDAGAQLVPAQRALEPFDLVDLAGRRWGLGELGHKPWIINFWATWCPPCIEEMPSLNRAYQALQPQGVGMLAINAGEGEAAVSDFLSRIDIDFPVLLGDGDTLPNWSVRALPTTFITDTAGQVRFEVLGPREWDDSEVAEAVLALV